MQQELAVLLNLWSKCPSHRNVEVVARYIIKSTDVSFIGKSIETIYFKSDNFSFKIKKEAVNLLSVMATTIQKYVRRYLVLLTSIHRANKRALMLSSLHHNVTCHEDDMGEFPETLEHDMHSTVPLQCKPLISRQFSESLGDSLVISPKSEASDEVEDAIRAQFLAQKGAYSSGTEVEPQNSGKTHRDAPSFRTEELSHSQKVEKLLAERRQSVINERSDKLMKKKLERKRKKLMMEEEKKRRELKDGNDTVESSLLAVTTAIKLKRKAKEAREKVRAAKEKDIKAREEEETAKMKALRNAALLRKNSEFSSRSELPTYKEFYVNLARANSGPDSHHGEYDDRVSDNKSSADAVSSILHLDNITSSSAVENVDDSAISRKLQEIDHREKYLALEFAKQISQADYDDTRPLLDDEEHFEIEESATDIVTATSIKGDAWDNILTPIESGQPLEEHFTALKKFENMNTEDVLSKFQDLGSNEDFNKSTLESFKSYDLLINWIEILFRTILHFREDILVVLTGLSLAVLFPYHKLQIPQHEIGFCGMIGQLLSGHIDSEKRCADILLFGVKFTSKDTVPNVEQAIDSAGLEMIVKVLLKYGQDRDSSGKAPASVTNCLKYVRNICVASSEPIQERLMAAGVGSLLLKLLVFYKSDEAVVGPVCRTMAALIRNSLCMNQFASDECIRLYMLILQTTPTNKVIAKAVGLLLIGIHAVDAEAARVVCVKAQLPMLLNNLLLQQMDKSSQFSLKVIETNMMLASYFITQAQELTEEFSKVDFLSTFHAYVENKQNFGKNVDLVVKKCIIHMERCLAIELAQQNNLTDGDNALVHTVDEQDFEIQESATEIVTATSIKDDAWDDILTPTESGQPLEEHFTALKKFENMNTEDVLSKFQELGSNEDFNKSSLESFKCYDLLINWIEILFRTILHFREDILVVLTGLSLAVLFPYHKLQIPQHEIGFCGMIGQLLSAHIDSEKKCADILLFGVKFTSKDTVPNVEQAIDSAGLEMIVKVLLKYGQDRDSSGKAPASVTNCLKYVRNICVASSEPIQERLMAAGVGSLLLKLLVFYKSDEAVVGPVCRTMAALIRNSLCMNQFASDECIRLYMLILQTTPTNKVIAKAVGLLLIGIHAVDAEAARVVCVKAQLPMLLNNLLLQQMDKSSQFSLKVIEANMMLASYFITQAQELTEEFSKVDFLSTFHAYVENKQNFGKNVDLVVKKCIKHFSSNDD